MMDGDAVTALFGKDAVNQSAFSIDHAPTPLDWRRQARF